MRTWMLVPVALAASLFSGCTPAPAPLVEPTPTAAPPTTGQRPPSVTTYGAMMLGDWTLTDVSDGMSARITFYDGGFWTAAYECGPISGQWATGANVFLAVEGGGSMGCSDNKDPQPTLAWIDSVVVLAPVAAGWDLLDVGGTVTATLTDQTPAPSPSPIDPRLPPVASFFDTSTPLSDEFEVRSLEGTWLPAGRNSGNASLTFDGYQWSSSDGCNGAFGKWADLGDGFLVTTPSGGMTLVGCENVPVQEWVAQARTAGFDGDELALFDAAGEELGRLLPAG